ncbi:hypothetical protein M758_2G242800 [Ceratodon purpureus]|nr:hypothetical protein M758_2G242800 [Ceratodon purpureus]
MRVGPPLPHRIRIQHPPRAPPHRPPLRTRSFPPSGFHPQPRPFSLMLRLSFLPDWFPLPSLLSTLPSVRVQGFLLNLPFYHLSYLKAPCCHSTLPSLPPSLTAFRFSSPALNVLPTLTSLATLF